MGIKKKKKPTQTNEIEKAEINHIITILPLDPGRL
jgi:hypothetical protein